MPIFRIENKKIQPVTEKKIDLERDIQKLTEENLETIFGLKFVSGATNREFSIRANEQDFYIDTVAFDEENKSVVLIEYKKDRSFSVIDQGFAYLSAMLNNKAEFILEINQKLNKSFGKSDIDWEQSRIIFVSNEFTNYQRNAINFKDLPMFLYEVHLYENNIIEFDPIKPFRTSESIKKIVKDKTIQSVSKEIKVYNPEDRFDPSWTNSKELFESLRKEILSFGNVSEITTKLYIAYKLQKNGQWYNFAEVIAQASGLQVHLDIDKKELNDPQKKTTDCSKVGHWATGHTKFKISDLNDLEYAIFLIKQTYKKVTESDISSHRGSSRL